MRVLITGTSGFIGRALAADMAAEHEVVCLSRQPTEVAGVEVVVGDFARGRICVGWTGGTLTRWCIWGR